MLDNCKKHAIATDLDFSRCVDAFHDVLNSWKLQKAGWQEGIVPVRVPMEQSWNAFMERFH